MKLTATYEVVEIRCRKGEVPVVTMEELVDEDAEPLGEGLEAHHLSVCTAAVVEIGERVLWTIETVEHAEDEE